MEKEPGWHGHPKARAGRSAGPAIISQGGTGGALPVEQEAAPHRAWRPVTGEQPPCRPRKLAAVDDAALFLCWAQSRPHYVLVDLILPYAKRSPARSATGFPNRPRRQCAIQLSEFRLVRPRSALCFDTTAAEPLLEGKDALPVVLHVNDDPFIYRCGIQSFVEVTE
jgi:hypothetical protein